MSKITPPPRVSSFPTEMSTPGSSIHHFKKGDKIEVLKNDGETDFPAWFPATIINSPSPAGSLHVKFNTLFNEKEGKDGSRKRKKIRKYIDVKDGVTRPIPPPEIHRWFSVGEEVEVFHDNGWRKGEVKDVLEDSKYTVVVGGGAVEAVVDNWRIRVFRDSKQNDLLQENSSQLVLQSKQGTKLRIICNSRNSKTATFQKGTPVEVKSNEEGYHGSWFSATIVESVAEDKFLVQYHTLRTDDEMQPLVEMAFASNIRHLPPKINRINRFEMLEEVDAWYNDGWWVGIVSKVLVRLKYVVYFWTTNEELEFQHCKLRCHQEFINGKWVASFLRPKLSVKPRFEKVILPTVGRTLMVGLLRGLKVEIAHGEKGSLTTWSPAVILGPVSDGKYLVEYRSLMTTIGREPVAEEVDVLSIRPSPPIIQRAHQFQPNDQVDGWDVNGWRIGQICRTMKDFKYEVYLLETNTVAEFQHANLRQHQDFVDGAWLLATTDIS